jgi:hypothetical protein
MKKTIITTIVLGLFFSTNAQVWTNIYKYYGDISDGGTSVIELPDGDLMVSGGLVGKLIRLKSNGKYKWRKDFDVLGSTDAVTMVLYSPTSLLIYASAKSNSAHTILLKSDLNGNELWHKEFNIPFGIPEIHINNEKKIDILDFTKDSSNFITLDSLGNIINQFSIPFYSNRFCRLSNGSYIFLENQYSTDTLNHRVRATTKNGSFLWEKTWKYARNLIDIGNDRFVILAQEKQIANPFLIEIDTLGNEIWRKTYVNINSFSTGYRANRLLLNNEKDIIFMGNINKDDPLNSNSFYITKTDIKGNLKCTNIPLI